MRRLASTLIVMLAASVGSTAYAAQSGNWNISSCKGDEGNTHNNSWWGGHQTRLCELRSTTIQLGGHQLGGQRLEVKSENGGIEIVGSDRSDVFIEARVQAWASSESDVKEILSKVVIETSGDSIRDDGPRSHLGNSGYGVNYRISAPRKLAAELKSLNGGIDISHLEGDIRFDTTNGGVGLNDLAGDVRGQTVNGGLDVTLTGDSWRGKGLNAETTNGGVSLKVPDNYSAHLEAGTVNGGIEVGFPITVQGEIKKHLSTNIGNGGATVHVETTNGGVEIGR